MIRFAYEAVIMTVTMTTLIVFLPNEADIGFRLNPGFVPGLFFVLKPSP